MMETFDIQNNTTVVDKTRTGQTGVPLNQSNNTTVVDTTDGILNQSNNTTVVGPTDEILNESTSYNGQDFTNRSAADGERMNTKSRLFDLVGMDSPVMHHDEEVIHT